MLVGTYLKRYMNRQCCTVLGRIYVQLFQECPRVKNRVDEVAFDSVASCLAVQIVLYKYFYFL